MIESLQSQKIIDICGSEYKGKKLIAIWKIDNKGNSLVTPSSYAFAYTKEIKVFCLSITHQRWVATTGDSAYICEMYDRETGDKYPVSITKKGS